jgi:transcription elongation GreA/GreB family factor
LSVAFRRDSDEEHLEPKFELPLPPGPNLVTPRGLSLIEARIAELERDLQAGEDEAAVAPIKRDLRYWHARQISAEVAPAATGDVVELGAEVRICINGKPRTFRIVGDDEADPASGLISFKSPLCLAMQGAEAGEILPFAGIEDAIQIIEIKVSDSETNGSSKHPG